MEFKATENDRLRATRMRSARLCVGMNQTDFAKAIHSGQQQVSGMENLKRRVSDNTAHEIAIAFPQFRIEWLLGFDDLPTIAESNWSKSEAINRLDDAIRALVKFDGYEVEKTFEETPLDIDGEPSTFIELRRSISKDGKTGHLTFSQNLDLLNEVAEFIEFKYQRAINRSQ